jgi:hypothetical protein
MATREDDRHKLARQLSGWAITLPHIKAEADRAAAEARERAEAERAQAEAEAREQARQAERDRWRAQQDARRLEEDRVRLARLERQWSLHRQAQARAVAQQRHEDFWAGISKGLDEMIPKPAPPVEPSAVQLLHSDEPYEGSGWLGSPDFNVALLTDPSRW